MSALASTARRTASQAWVLPAAGFAAIVGYLTVARFRVGVVTALLPVAGLLMLSPWYAVAAAIALTPIQVDLGGGTTAGLNVAVSDVLVLIAVAGFIPLVLIQQTWRDRLRDARPAVLWTFPFLLWIAIVVLAHPSSKSAQGGIQYAELTAVAIALGAVAMNRQLTRWALAGFVAIATFTAVLWIAGAGFGDKNPSGQFMVDAALLSLAAIKRWRYRLPMLLLLIVGTLFTQSRGAVLGAAIGALVLLAFRGLGTWRRTVATLVPLALLVVVGYNVVPVSLQARVQSTFSSVQLTTSVGNANTVNGTLTSAKYSIELREIYRRQGIDFAKHHEVFGAGLGNYLTGQASEGTLTNDPHDVLILDAGEGGVPDLILFIVMIAGTSFVVIRRFKRNPWAGPALAVQAAILTHGLVDVYWVRGTPIVGWFLVGLALNRRLDHANEPTPDAELLITPQPALV